MKSKFNIGDTVYSIDYGWASAQDHKFAVYINEGLVLGIYMVTRDNKLMYTIAQRYTNDKKIAEEKLYSTLEEAITAFKKNHEKECKDICKQYIDYLQGKIEELEEKLAAETFPIDVIRIKKEGV